MWNEPTKQELDLIPKLYETEGVPIKDKIIHMHFFLMGSDWYVCEFDPKEKVFFGFVILGNDFHDAEWGYTSLKELEKIHVQHVQVDRDLDWKKQKARDIEKICRASGWTNQKK